ncbi:hypothetical protein ATANTOWER_013584 [Ataeniobius toweri]|uniref:Uncharacterized protein n=1 Tax=Ataeniobius toweri TaxID=208326 RepID=A0ABU7BR41_9TELE|nr:hypothetical protein [Ataeniobius toweri]
MHPKESEGEFEEVIDESEDKSEEMDPPTDKNVIEDDQSIHLILHTSSSDLEQDDDDEANKSCVVAATSV